MNNIARASYSVTEGFPERRGLYSGYFRTERRCPECGKRMQTNGNGDFRCLPCDYQDKQDVRWIKEAGLGYKFTAHSKGQCAVFGSNNI